MQIRNSQTCDILKNMVENVVHSNAALAANLEGISLEFGPANETDFQVPYHARNPLFVGDAAHTSAAQVPADVAALFKADPNAVACVPKWNEAAQNWTHEMMKATGDSAYSLLGGQMYAPGMISYFTKVFKEPLSYSHAEKLVRNDPGTNPWATLMTMAVRQFGGAAALGLTGSAQNNMTNDVQVRDGLLTGSIINMSATWTYTLEEMERNKSSNYPFGNQGMNEKVPYANYVLKLMTDYITYYGLDSVDVNGLMQINPVEAWSGESLQEIRNDTTITTKGSRVYNQMAKVINDFLAPSDNKFNKIVIAMSPDAYNNFCSMPYSDEFDPTSAIKIFNDNYNAGKGKDDKRVDIEFISDPMLKGGTIFNKESADFMVITAPEITAGPNEETQALVQRGMPLEKFIFPAIPGQYNTQYKMLRRCSGVFAPVPHAVKVYQGFGSK